ncbi:hypothetical protein [Methylobacterium sp. Leaf118]|uniref:hypothetical protein n=1 Tax=Methylobacterium sp. Leaf118 TaxID=2876562 RepID=UPI001E43177E|nr:hypothetical protein [Methylobacterium sp. Leaf118]
MLAIPDFRPGRIGLTVADILAKLRGLVPDPKAEPELPSPEERAARRDEAGSVLAALAAERDRELPRLAEAEHKAAQHLASLAPAFRAAEKAYAAAQDARFRREHDFRYSEESLRRQVHASHEPIIDEFIQDLYALWQANLEEPVNHEQRGTYFDRERVKRYPEIWSNAAAKVARRKAILAARDAAEAMKFDLDQSGIEGRLAAILESLPDGTEMTEVTGR